MSCDCSHVPLKKKRKGKIGFNKIQRNSEKIDKCKEKLSVSKLSHNKGDLKANTWLLG